MEINKVLRLPQDQFYQDVVAKKQIYLHHTVGGSAKSSFDYWLSNSERIGTAFLVERDGTIFEVFDSRYWAHHLGLKLPYNTLANKQSIGIELASEGALRNGVELNNVRKLNKLPEKFDSEWLYAFDINVPPKDDPRHYKPEEWFSRAKKLYHMFDDKAKYFHCGLPFRGYSFFDLYDEAQIVSTNELVGYLCELHGISKNLIEGDKLHFDETLVMGLNGVLTHCNVRIDKSDLCPAFDWELLQSTLK